MLNNLISIDGFEEFLHVKFPAAKRFSIEGGGSVIAGLIEVIEEASNNNLKEVVIGMAHRGRLVTLAEVAKKPHHAIISEFLGTADIPASIFNEKDSMGDVKYHMGYSSSYITRNGNVIKVSLTPNPSHLEAVNPIVAGKVRAKQDMIGDISRQQVMGILIHGDASFSGQGIVAESLLMSVLSAYNVGGILHFIVNNQLGFTANASEIHPGHYTTEVAKIIKAPILHVNGNDPESVLKASLIAINYKQKFAKDVVVDIICYRKYGHNEGDEPMYTQPLMYNIIKDKKSISEEYAQVLIDQQLIQQSDYENSKQKLTDFLNKEFNIAKNYKPVFSYLEGVWQGINRFNNIKENKKPTGVKSNILMEFGKKLCSITPEFILDHPKFVLHFRLKKIFDDRLKRLTSDGLVDWALAEQLAFASLLTQNIPVRLIGQDSERGTFSHRHAILHSQEDQSYYVPLNHVAENQLYFQVANSHLSEYGALGFEYGYSLANPNQLVIWEAQFGDFANGAQIIFDQFISASEMKWLRMSNIILLLPHGYEGQGPEHSSARVERYLQLAANDNIQVVNPTTPASYFHLLRRQVVRNIRKPLIVMSPKSLLRHKDVVSSLDELGENSLFSPVIDDIDASIIQSRVSNIIICSGKVFYDLCEFRQKNKVMNSCIIRIEQYYPFPKQDLLEILKKYSSCKDIVWCQEEPSNMGAWVFIQPYLNDIIKECQFNINLRYAGRIEASSPATGYLKIHNQQQENLLKQAFNIGV